jgi:uncharacterized protein YjiS (DUF1127 family)
MSSFASNPQESSLQGRYALARFRGVHMSAIRFEDMGGRIAGVRRSTHSAGSAAARVFGALREWRRRSKDRAELAALDDRMLTDIGISRAEAEFLANKPFWKE